MDDKLAENAEARVQALLEVTTALLSLDDEAELKAVLNTQRAADVADLLRRVDEETQEFLFGLLDETQAADALVESDIPTLHAIVEELEPQILSDIVEEMEPDDAADVLGDLNDEDAAEVLTLMASEQAQEVQELLVHEEDTGGGLMTPDFVLVHKSATVGDAIQALRDDEDTSDHYYVFVVDDEMRPVGTISIHRLVRAQPDQAVEQVMDGDVITVAYQTDQEEIARMFERYDFMAMPVVDENGRLVGRITADDVMDVIQEENAEDFYKMEGTNQDEVARPSILGIARSRMPWLLIGMGGSLLAGGVIESFKMTLAEVFTLAAFLPVIMAMGGSSGLQACTVTVRGLVTGQVSTGLVLRTVLREVATAVLIGAVCGAGASLVAYVWFGETLVGICVGVSMLLVICLSVFIGVSAPLIFHRFGIDPAVASGPFITISNDILGVSIYLGLATTLLHYFSDINY